MLRSNKSKQNEIEFISIEELVPEDHLLRKVDQYIDFSFILDKVKHLYSENNGRPSIDPIVLFKMMFIGYFYGIRSERQLEREIQVNVAYRWFLGMNLSDSVPDHTTISWNRRKRFKGTTVFQDIFDEIVLLAQSKHMVNGRVLFTDSTHLKANANKKKFIKKEVEASTKSYIEELDQAVEEDRKNHGKKPLKKKETEVEEKEIKVSTTDPESGYMYRDQKPEGFFYLDHRTTDLKFNIITDVHVTPGNMHDSVPYLERLDRQIERFGFKVEATALDSGYLTMPICKGLIDRKIFGVIGHRRFSPVKGLMPKWKFNYDLESDTYTCPNGETLRYSTTDRNGYKHYKSNPELCSECPLLDECTKSKESSKNHHKTCLGGIKRESSRESAF